MITFMQEHSLLEARSNLINSGEEVNLATLLEAVNKAIPDQGNHEWEGRIDDNLQDRSTIIIRTSVGFDIAKYSLTDPKLQDMLKNVTVKGPTVPTIQPSSSQPKGKAGDWSVDDFF